MQFDADTKPAKILALRFLHSEDGDVAIAVGDENESGFGCFACDSAQARGD